MTEAQQAVIVQIKELMREHFNAALFVCEGDSTVHGVDSLTYATCGPWSSSVGLAEYAKDLLVRAER